MKQYFSFFRIRFIAGLQYRAAAWAGVVTQFAWGFLSILMYRAFYQSGAENFPMEFSQLTTYIWLQQALLAMFMIWLFDNDIFDSITSGNIAYELCRPCDLYNMWFVKNVATRLSNVLLRCLPIFIVAACLPYPYNISLPADWACGALFFVSLIAGFFLQVSISMVIYISAFYTVSPAGMKILSVTLMEFLSGAVIPIPFFPETVQTIFNLLPFASMQSTPFLIYTGYTSGADALAAIGVQLFWLVVIYVSGRLLIKHALKKVVVQGG